MSGKYFMALFANTFPSNALRLEHHLIIIIKYMFILLFYFTVCYVI